MPLTVTNVNGPENVANTKNKTNKTNAENVAFNIKMNETCSSCY